MLVQENLDLFSKLVDEFAADCNKWAHGNGFWDFSNVSDKTLQRCYELSISQWEISQELEAIRNGVDLQSIFEGTKWPENPSREIMESVCKVLLIHSEVSEIFHAIVFNNMDDHLPEFKGMVAENADTLIRIFDLASQLKLPLGEAIVAKQRYNESRPFRNGKAF